MGTRDVFTFYKMLKSLMFVIDSQSYKKLESFIKKYFKNIKIGNAWSFNQLYEATIERWFNESYNGEGIIQYGDKYFFLGEDQDGEYIQDLNTKNKIYVKIKEELEEYFEL